MTIKWNIIGNDFIHITNEHKGYSTHGKNSEYITWVTDGSGEINIYLESAMDLVFSSNSNKPNYLWMIESKAIHSNEYNKLENNFSKYADKYTYIFTHDVSLIEKYPNKCLWLFATGYWIKNPQMHDKNKLLSIISSGKSSTEGQKYRHNIINKFKYYIDTYGHGYNPIQNKEQGLEKYMFHIAIENSKYAGYFTEKILDCFVTGTVPVYWGCPNIGDYFNTDGIIFLDDTFDLSKLNKELYDNMKPAIEDNFQRALKYILAEDYIYENYLGYSKPEKFIDVIYYINLEHRQDRNNDILNEISKFVNDKVTVSRIDAIYTPGFGAYGCSQSHIKALESFLESEYQTCIIFEDDFEFTLPIEQFRNMLRRFFADKGNDWDIVMLSSNTHYSILHNEYLDKAISVQTASGYMINRHFANKLLDNFKEGCKNLGETKNIPIFAIDMYWKRLQSGSKWYIFKPKIGRQRAGFSDIENTIVNYGV
jgi:hypothetical protein